MDDALKIADAMLPKCDIIYTLDKNENKRVSTSDANTIDVPLVVLVDENSASASEIVSGSLQDNKAATLVGTKTFGKGIIQILMPMTDGSLYKYSFQEYYVPSGTKIHGVGITPDVVVEQDKTYEKYLVEMIPEGKDVQLNKALEIMKEKLGQ